MSRHILNGLPELVENGLISSDTARNIAEYYAQKNAASGKSLIVVFSVLGALVSALGLILIVAHNWDIFSKSLKTLFAFIPLVLSQVLCVFIILRKRNLRSWRESGALLLFGSIGAGIALISQIYHIPGNLSGFLLTWVLLAVPVVYLMNSASLFILALAGITWYLLENDYFQTAAGISYGYWLVMLSLIPFYIFYIIKAPMHIMTLIFHWMIPVALFFGVLGLAVKLEEFPGYSFICLFSIYFLVGQRFFPYLNPVKSGYSVIGLTGVIVVLLLHSYQWFWNAAEEGSSFSEYFIQFNGPWLFTSLFLTASGLLISFGSSYKSVLNPLSLMFLIFLPVFVAGYFSPLLARILTNLLVLITGVYIISEGIKRTDLKILNIGLFVIGTLIILRFFDENISFVVRGSLFILLGIAFFVLNYLMLKVKKGNG